MRGGQERHFRSHNRPAQVGATHRHDQARRNHDFSPRTHHVDHQSRHRRVTHAGQFAARHHAQRQQGDQQIDREGGEHRQQRCATDIALVSGAGRNHDGTFHANKHPQGDQHGVFNLLPHGDSQRQSAEIEAERIQLEGQGGERDKRAQRQEFGEGGHQVNPRRRLHAAQDQKMDNPQQNRSASDRLPGVAIAKQAQLRGIGEETERRKDDDQIGDVGDHRAEPVSPGGTEANQLTEPFAGVGEDPAVEVGANAG